MLLVFDVNETLLDLAPLDAVLSDITGTPEARREWFELVIHTALTVTASGGYRDFAEIAGAAAAAVAERHGRTLSSEQRAAVGATLRSLPAHPEVPGALAWLRQGGHQLVTLTNSPRPTAQAQLSNAGLTELFDEIYSADAVRALKPAPAPYRHVLDAHAIAPTDAMMVAAHGWDIAGAQAVGMRTAFLARPGQFPLPVAGPSTIVAADLTELANKI